MKRVFVVLAVPMVLGVVLFSGCATTQTWPDYERSAENKMVLIQEKIGDGLQTGALSPDQSQMFLTSLKGIRTDYAGLRNRHVNREEWSSIIGRLDVLNNEIDRALTRTSRPQFDQPSNSEKLIAVQRKIDDGRMRRRWSASDGRDYQVRLDSIRNDYLRMTEGGRYASNEERADVSRRLDSLEADLDRYR